MLKMGDLLVEEDLMTGLVTSETWEDYLEQLSGSDERSHYILTTESIVNHVKMLLGQSKTAEEFQMAMKDFCAERETFIKYAWNHCP